MKSGFSAAMKRKRNKVGNVPYDAADKEICARLAGNDVDEVFADEHVRKCLDEIHATWIPGEAERRVVQKQHEFVAPQIVVHHFERFAPFRVNVE